MSKAISSYKDALILVKDKANDAIRFTMEGWELYHDADDVHGFNILFNFHKPWVLDDISVAIINLREHTLHLHVFHDDTMDIIEFDTDPLTLDQLDDIFQANVNHKLNFINQTFNDKGDPETFKMPISLMSE